MCIVHTTYQFKFQICWIRRDLSTTTCSFYTCWWNIENGYEKPDSKSIRLGRRYLRCSFRVHGMRRTGSLHSHDCRIGPVWKKVLRSSLKVQKKRAHSYYKYNVYIWYPSYYSFHRYPIGSMYGGIFSYTHHTIQPKVSKDTIHGSYGYASSYSIVAYCSIWTDSPKKRYWKLPKIDRKVNSTQIGVNIFKKTYLKPPPTCRRKYPPPPQKKKINANLNLIWVGYVWNLTKSTKNRYNKWIYCTL